MRECIDNRVATGNYGNYGNTSEYIREMVRRDQEEQSDKRLRDLVEAGLASGPGRPRTKAGAKEPLAIARGDIAWSRRFSGRRRCTTSRAKSAIAARRVAAAWR